MFIHKIKKIAQEMERDFAELEEFAREALLYGMNLTRNPGALKRAMKRIDGDSTQATTQWSGNAYLLHVLPQALTNKRCKVVNLEDYAFARKCLRAEDYETLRKRLENTPGFSVHDIVGMLKSEIKQQASGSRFLIQFDQMYESRNDIEHDITDKALTVINKEFTNFNSHNEEDIKKYISCCLSRKAKTYVRSKAPRMKMVRTQDHQDLERIMDENCEIEQDPIRNLEFKKDIGNFLSETQQQAILIFLGMAEEPLRKSFDQFLSQYNKTTAHLSQAHLKNYITLFLGVDVFAGLKANAELKQYLIEAV